MIIEFNSRKTRHPCRSVGDMNTKARVRGVQLYGPHPQPSGRLHPPDPASWDMRGTPGQIHRRYGVKKSENLKMGMSPLGMGTCCTPGGKHVYSVYLHPFSEATRASQTNLNSRHIFFHSLVLETNTINKNSLPFCPVGWQQHSVVFLWM